MRWVVRRMLPWKLSSVNWATLERLCWYGARGPLALERLSWREDGRLSYRAAYLTLINHARQRIYLENSFPMADDLVDALADTYE